MKNAFDYINHFTRYWIEDGEYFFRYRFDPQDPRHLLTFVYRCMPGYNAMIFMHVIWNKTDLNKKEHQDVILTLKKKVEKYKAQSI